MLSIDKVRKLAIGMFVFIFIIVGILPRAFAVPVNIGDSITFEFELPAFNPSDFYGLRYNVNASADAPGLFGFLGTISIYDEMNESPLFEHSNLTPSLVFAPNWVVIFFDSDPEFAPLTNDPVSYMRINLTGLLDNNSDWDNLDFADFNPGLTLYADIGSAAEDIIVAGTASVPEPSTILLLGSGLIGLAGFRRKRFKK